jgi:hypothetical protein
MFLQNKYTTYYYNIINASKASPPIGYTEKHHIVPKSLGGSNDLSNLVRLTARQHYVCHLLLTKMLPKSHHQKKLLHAFSAFLMRASPTNQREKITSKQYEMLRKARSESAKGHKPNLGHKRTIESKKNQSNTMKQKYASEKHPLHGLTYEQKYGPEEAQARCNKLKGPRGPRLVKRLMPTLKCPHCSKIGGAGNMKRYHFDNCSAQKFELASHS